MTWGVHSFHSECQVWRADIYIYTYIPWNAPRSKDAMVTTSMTWYFLDPRIPSWTFTSHWHPGRRSIPIYSSVWKDITYNLFQIAIAWVSIYSSDFRYESIFEKSYEDSNWVIEKTLEFFQPTSENWVIKDFFSFRSFNSFWETIGNPILQPQNLWDFAVKICLLVRCLFFFWQLNKATPQKGGMGLETFPFNERYFTLLGRWQHPNLVCRNVLKQHQMTAPVTPSNMFFHRKSHFFLLIFCRCSVKSCDSIRELFCTTICFCLFERLNGGSVTWSVCFVTLLCKAFFTEK